MATTGVLLSLSRPSRSSMAILFATAKKFAPGFLTQNFSIKGGARFEQKKGCREK